MADYSGLSTSISRPVQAQWSSKQLLQGAGVAIFHLRTSRVVLCYHPNDKYWFLPKGRKDVGEGIDAAAQREGYEESGYRNRLLPLPLRHWQTHPSHIPKDERDVNVTETVWMYLLPATRTVQYVVQWFIAETVPPDIENELSGPAAQPASDAAGKYAAAGAEQKDVGRAPYRRPPPYPADLKLRDRIALEPADYEPRWHAGTGVDEDEALYQSHLLEVDDAIEKLKGTGEEDVVRIGWAGIKKRFEAEAAESSADGQGRNSKIC